MPTYLYKGYDKTGNFVSGCSPRNSENILKSDLEKKEIIKVEVFETKTTYSNKNFNLVSAKEISIFCKQMYAMISSNIGIVEGIEFIKSEATNKELKIALEEIEVFMENGLSFWESISMYKNIFDNYLLNMVCVGELSGSLDEVFFKMSDYYEKESRIQKKIKSAITYPLILMVMMTALVILLITKILPMFNNILTTMGGQMHPFTKVLFVVSDFLNKYGFVVLGILLVLIIGFRFYFRTEKGKYKSDKFLAETKLGSSFYSKVMASRFSRSLAILIKSGIPVSTALTEVSNLIDNIYLKEKMMNTMETVEDGENLSYAIEKSDFFPPLFVKMLAIGERTGKTDEMLEKTAIVFDDEVDDTIEKFTQTIEPVMIIILSIVVGFILISVMLPMTNIINSIG